MKWLSRHRPEGSRGISLMHGVFLEPKPSWSFGAGAWGKEAVFTFVSAEAATFLNADDLKYVFLMGRTTLLIVPLDRLLTVRTEWSRK